MNVVGYVRVSTGEQGDSGAGLEAQRRAIRTACKARGWTVEAVYEDRAASGRSLNRDGLKVALAAVESGEADALVVAKLDRLSRSLIDFAGLMARSHKKGWGLVALDLGVDTTSPAGELMANVMASVAQWERQIIGQRTKDALAVRKSEGVKLGRPRTLPARVVKRIIKERNAGRTLRAIGEGLERDGIATAHGGKAWYPATIRSVLASSAHDPGA